MKHILNPVITGPTATGKSSLGIMLAQKIDGEIVSADSMQVYKHMDIGTAKPTSKEMYGVPHHMLDFVPPQENYSVAQYVKEASICIDDIIKRGKQPIIVGGSGLYIDSLLAGRTFLSRGDNKLREQLENEFDNTGGDIMLSKLRDVDPESAVKLHSNDKKRIVRALESYITTGKTISQHDIESKAIPPRYDAVKIALSFSDRADLYANIDRRVDEMISDGLVDEVRSLMKMGVPRKSTSMQAIGYKEISAAIDSGSDISEAVEKIKMESRRYAKRQLTWLRRDNEIKWIIWENTPDLEGAVQRILELINEKK